MLVVWLGIRWSSAAAPPAPSAPLLPPPESPAPAAFEPGLSSNTDLLLLPLARRPSPRPVVTAATRVMAAPDAVTAVLLNPTSLRQALPSLIRAEIVASRPGPRPDAWPDRLIAWEVEIPLFNLKSRGWLRQRPQGAELELVEGAFAPGMIQFRTAPTIDRTGTILTCQVQLEIQSTTWILRKISRHDPWAETAMSAAAAWVVARALALRAEAAPGPGAALVRPREPIQPPAAAELEGSFMGGPALAGLRATGVLGAIRRRPGGRLGWASVAFRVPGSPPDVVSRLATPESWAVFPAWKSVTRRPPPEARGVPGPAPRASAKGTGIPTQTETASATGSAGLAVVDVVDRVPLADLDAAWSVELTPPGRATAIAGDTRGAVLAWQAAPAQDGQGSTVVLSMHPRLDAAGFVERRLIAAEPLLEHGLGIALAYVDAAAMAESLDLGLPLNDRRRGPGR